MKILTYCLLFFALWMNTIGQVKATTSIDTLESYIHLVIYNGAEDSIYIKHERYYGLFVKDSCTTEDYGTRILSASGCWKRVHQNFSPRFWEIGGQSPDFLIGSVREEVDAINSAAIAAYHVGGDTIEIDSMYVIDRPVFLLSNNTYLGTSDSAGFARITPPRTILVDTAKIGDRQITVESTEGFRTYQQINIATHPAYDSLAGYLSYTASVASWIGGDTTIWLSGLPMQRTMLPGDTVSLFFPMMSPRFTNLDSVYLKNLVFEGNRAHYNLNFDWRVNTTIILPTSNESIIDHCRFYEIPSENMFLCGATLRNCSGTAFNGSALHFSCNSLDRPTDVFYNNFSSLNHIGDSIMEHSEAGLTFSSRVQNLRVAYNRITGIQGHGIGAFTNDDQSNEITDNLIETPEETIRFNPFYEHSETNLIYNNKNPLKADSSQANCLLAPIQPLSPLQCQANSSLDQPLNIGDTIHIVLDSLWLRNSNANFVKCIEPIYQSDFFSLVDARLSTPTLSSFHQWHFDKKSTICLGAVFDNGHRNGRYGEGNWGYELCGQNGGCFDLTFSFVVQQLPLDSAQTVDCPMTGLNIQYDGEVGSWEAPLYCQKEAVLFDPLVLGQPVLAGDLSTSVAAIQSPQEVRVYPNPGKDHIIVDLPLGQKSPYQIFSTTGILIKGGVLDSEGYLSIDQLSPGLYLLELSHQEQPYYAYFVKAW